MMENQILFDYHYAEEAERYAFYRIPKALYTEPMFRELSDSAKVLYGQLLDLMSLSRKNDWTDEQGRVYIRCGINRIKEIMNCSNDKAVKMLKELDVVSGVGLIEKVKHGQGKTAIIYVKSFVMMKNRSEAQLSEIVVDVNGIIKGINHKTESPCNESEGFSVSKYENSEKRNARIL